MITRQAKSFFYTIPVLARLKRMYKSIHRGTTTGWALLLFIKQSSSNKMVKQRRTIMGVKPCIHAKPSNFSGGKL